MSPHRTLVAALALAACGRTADDGSADGESVADESGSESESESGTESDSETESESDSETESDSESGTDGDNLTFEELKMLCEAQIDQASCEAQPEIPNSRGGAYCAWSIEVPVELLVDEACSFGVPITGCLIEHFGDSGCAQPQLCGTGELGWSRVENDTIIVGRGNFCADGIEFCVVDGEGNITEGIPECKCLCDPLFPL